MQLSEQYRPKTWSEVVGQDKVIAKIQALANRSLSGRAYWISGQSGTGKTTIARLIAAEIATDFYVEELDAAGLSVNDLEECERGFRFLAMGERTGKVIIINEAHALRKPVIRQLLVMLERLPAHVAVIFTTTCEGQASLFEDYDDASPLLSRCIRLDLARRGLCEPFAQRLKENAMKEGLDGKPIEHYIRLMKDHGNNMRSGYQSIESGCMMD